jgi:4-hydroxybenzoate polyprenyltransferase
MLIAVYINHLTILPHLDIFIGFFFYAITGNTLNDALDARNPKEVETIERIQGYHWKEIATIAIVCFIFGTMMFVRTISQHPLNGLLLAGSVIMVIIYCLKKDIPIFNQILLGISHVVLPYLMIKVDANTNPLISSTEWFGLFVFFAFAYTGQIVHEAIDGDSITRFSLKTQQIVIITSSCITFILGIIAVYLLNFYFLPFVFIPIGSIYTFRYPTHSTKGVKDVGIILGNVIMIYFLVLILMQL